MSYNRPRPWHEYPADPKVQNMPLTGLDTGTESELVELPYPVVAPAPAPAEPAPAPVPEQVPA